MASTKSKLGNQEETSTKKPNPDNWKLHKIPVNQVYKKKALTMFPSYVIKDFKDTVTLKSNHQDVSVQLLTSNFLKGFVKKQHKFLHLGLVQIAIKPLLRDGVGDPIIVCLRDSRHLDFKNSLLALVEANLSQGPFYFNCFPSFSVSLGDTSSLKVLTLCVKTSGVPLALTYRIVAKAMVDLRSEALKEPVLEETTYFQANSGVPKKTKWDDVQVPEGWTRPEDHQVAKKKSNTLETVTLPDGRVVMRLPSARDDYD